MNELEWGSGHICKEIQRSGELDKKESSLVISLNINGFGHENNESYQSTVSVSSRFL
jgi:hypothetical protein